MGSLRPVSDPATLLLVHALAPPASGGVGVVLNRLLTNLSDCRVVTLTDERQRSVVEAGSPLVSPGAYRYFRKLGGRFAGLPLIRDVLAILNLPFAVGAGWRGAALARSENATWVMSVIDGAFSPIAGALAARWSGRPHVLMIFDPWRENAYGPVTRFLGRLLERRIVGGAARVLVYCDQAAEHYAQRYGATCEVIPTPVAAVDLDSVTRQQDTGTAREIVLGGSVYWAQDDAVRRLLRVARRRPDVTVTMIGDPARTNTRRYRPDRFERGRPEREFVERLRAADVLFLGVGVDARHRFVVRMMTPARLVDYMAAGRPILVHAPRGSYAAEYARQGDFAEVVDEASDSALDAALTRMAADPETAARRSLRASQLVRERHEPALVGARLRAALEAAAPSQRAESSAQ